MKRYDPNLQNDTKLEMTSCSIAEKMALDEPLFCTESLYGKHFSGVNPKVLLREQELRLATASLISNSQLAAVNRILKLGKSKTICHVLLYFETISQA